MKKYKTLLDSKELINTIKTDLTRLNHTKEHQLLISILPKKSNLIDKITNKALEELQIDIIILSEKSKIEYKTFAKIRYQHLSLINRLKQILSEISGEACDKKIIRNETLIK
ncbi:MAG: hypothetical protein ACFBSE_07950 [Prochloraceae cyanobacterium]